MRSSRPGSHDRQPERRAGGAWPVEPESGTRPGPGGESSAGNNRGSGAEGRDARGVRFPRRHLDCGPGHVPRRRRPARATPCLVPVPSLGGNQLDDVRRQLARAKLEVGKVNTRESDRVRGTVIGQSPVSGTRVKCGSPIDVVVAIPIPQRADDVPPETPCVVPVPNLTGNQLGDVRQLLARAKLDVGRVNTRESDGVRGTVIGQSPASGTRVRCGSPIDVVVAIPVPQRPDDVQPEPLPGARPHGEWGRRDETTTRARETRAGHRQQPPDRSSSRHGARPVAAPRPRRERAARRLTCGLRLRRRSPTHRSSSAGYRTSLVTT